MKRPCSGWQPALTFLSSLWLGLCSPFTSKAQTLGPSLVADQARVFSSVATPGSGSLADFAEYTDAAGNTYQAGTFTGTVQFGAFSFTSPASNDYEVVVAKRDAAGNYQWAVAGGGIGTQRAKALAIDATGNVYVTGFFNSATATFGPSTLTNARPVNSYTSDVFVLKITASGTWQWAVSAGGGTYINGNDYGTALAVDAAGGVYVAGTYTSSVAFFGPSIQLATTDPYASSSANTIFVAKLNASGNWQWARRNEYYSGSAESLTTDAAANVYLTARFSLLTQFGSFVIQSKSYDELALAKISSAGVWQWATGTQGARLAATFPTTIQVGTQADLYLVGYFSGDTLRLGSTTLKNTGGFDSFVAKLNATTGRWRWAVQTQGQDGEVLTAALLDGQGHLCVGGNFAESGSQDPATWPRFGTTQLRSAGGRDIVVAQLDTAGTWQWARRAGGTAHEQAGPSYIDGQGQVFVSGTFEGATLPLGVSMLTASPISFIPGQFSAFRTRLGANALAVVNTTAGPSWEVYPNPARTSVTVSGLAAGQQVELLDALGQRRVMRATVPARGPLQVDLPLGLAAGLYLVRASGQARRVAVE